MRPQIACILSFSGIFSIQFYHLALSDDTLTQRLNIWMKCKFDQLIKIRSEKLCHNVYDINKTCAEMCIYSFILFWNYSLVWPTLWVLTGLSASPLSSHTRRTHRHKNTTDTDWRRDNDYQVERRWWSKLRSFFSLPSICSGPQTLHLASHDPLTAAITTHWKCPSHQKMAACRNL